MTSSFPPWTPTESILKTIGGAQLMIIVIGWTLGIILIAAVLVRYLTVSLSRMFTVSIPTASMRWRQPGIWVLTCLAGGIAVFAIVGSIWLPLSGVYGPSTLVLAVLWQINAGWKIRYSPWIASVDYGLEYGERFLLAGGSLATLIAYLWTIPY